MLSCHAMVPHHHFGSRSAIRPRNLPSSSSRLTGDTTGRLVAQSASAGCGPSSRSPACVAVKIRCRSRRTSSSTGASPRLPVRKSSSGPFTVSGAAARLVSNLPIGSGVRTRFASTGSPGPRQRPFGPGTPARIRPVIREPPAEEPVIRSRFPAAFRPPAFASWAILRPLGNCAFLTVGLPARTRAGPRRGCHVPHGETRPGWVPSIPRGRWCAPGRSLTPAGTCRLPAASPCYPAAASHRRESTYHEASSRVHSRSPVRSSPRLCPPDGTGALGLYPGLRTPRLPTTHARAGTVHAHWTGNYVTNISRSSFGEFHSPPWMHGQSKRHTHAPSDDHGQFCYARAEEAPGLVAVVATLSKGYDLDYIWKQVDRGPAKDAASYYIQASESGGEPPGRWWGPGAKALGFEPGQRVEREPYDLLFGERKAPDGTQLGRPPDSGRKAADLYAAAAGRRAARHRRAQARAADRGRQEGPAEPAVLRPDPVAVQVDLDLPRLPRRERPPGPPGRRPRRRCSTGPPWSARSTR